MQFIKNLSSHKLTNTEIIALGKGLKFIPTPTKPNIKQIIQDFNKYSRIMRLRYIMRHKQSQQHPFKGKSNWTPRSTENTKLESYLEATKLALLDLPFHKVKQNMSTVQKKSW